MPKFRSTGKSQMRVGNQRVNQGDVIECEANPDPRRFVEVTDQYGSEDPQPAVAEATPIKVQWRKPRTVTNEEEA